MRIIAGLLAALGIIMVAYAISDHPFYGGEPGFGRIQALIAAFGSGLVLCAFSPTAIAERTLLLTVASVAALAFAECAGEMVLGPRLRPIYQADDQLIFRFVPGRTSVMTRGAENGGETVIHHINSDGFRGAELRPAGELTRVVVYGDSFIHAFYSHDNETFVAQLGARLTDHRGREIETINAGVSSYGPDQVAQKMEHELPLLQPDLVVVAIFAGNDYGDLMRNKMFRLAEDGSLVENRWTLEPELRARFRLNQQGSILVRATRSALDSLRASPRRREDTTSMDFLLQEAQREYQSFVVDGDDVIRNTHVDYYGADVSLTPEAPSARYKIALMRGIIHRILDVARRNQTPLAFLLIPHPLDVTNRADWGKVDREPFPDYASRNQVGFLEDILRAAGAPYVNLYDNYQATNADTLYFHGGDDHWNAAGQKVAAEAMAAYLISRGMPATR